jgi:hypothetical protein
MNLKRNLTSKFSFNKVLLILNGSYGEEAILKDLDMFNN